MLTVTLLTLLTVTLARAAADGVLLAAPLGDAAVPEYELLPPAPAPQLRKPSPDKAWAPPPTTLLHDRLRHELLDDAGGDAGDALPRVAAPRLVARARVSGRGSSLRADSAERCLQLCRQRPDACDAANYHAATHKCRLLARCAPSKLAFHHHDYHHFAARPHVRGAGFSHEPSSGSCVKVVTQQADYAGADRLCESQGGRLAALTSPELNDFAAALLRQAGAQYGWIGLRDVDGREGDPTHSDGSSVSQRRFFRPAPQHWRNATDKNCWALGDDGRWAELSCKTRRLVGVCEVPLF